MVSTENVANAASIIPYGTHDSVEIAFANVLRTTSYFQKNVPITTLQCISVAHGIKCAHDVNSYIDSLVHHFFYGLCVSSQCFETQDNSLTCALVTQRHVSLFISLHDAGTVSLLQISTVCKLLGYRSSQTSYHAFLDQHVESLYHPTPHGIPQLLNDVMFLPRHRVLLCGQHGIPLFRTVEEQKSVFFRHLVGGHCHSKYMLARCSGGPMVPVKTPECNLVFYAYIIPAQL